MSNKSIIQLFEISRKAYVAGNYNKAFAAINKVKRLSGVTDVDTNILDVKINLALGKTEKALTILEHKKNNIPAYPLSIEEHDLLVNIYRKLHRIDDEVFHLEKMIIINSTINNAKSYYRLLSYYVEQEKVKEAKVIGKKLLNWQSYYVPALLLLIDVAVIDKDYVLVGKYARLLISNSAFLNYKDTAEVFSTLIKLNVLSEARLLIERSISVNGETTWSYVANAILSIKSGDITRAKQIFKSIEGENYQYSLNYYRALRDHYFNEDKFDSFFSLIQDYDNDFIKIEFSEEYISTDDYETLLRLETENKENNYLYCLVDYNKLIAYWLLGDYVQCNLIIKKNGKFIAEHNLEKHLVVPQVFFRYIKALLKFSNKEKHPLPIDGAEKLYVIGESHSLALNNRVLSLNGTNYQGITKFVKGVQMHHLNNDRDGKHKYYVERHLTAIESEANLLFVIGEIDSRNDKGICKAARKEEKTVAVIANRTVATYLDFIKTSITDISPKAVFIHGVPAANITNKQGLDYQRHCAVIKEVNIALKQGTLDNNWQFIDVYATTVNSTGWSNGKWHIDQCHLKPSVYDNLIIQ